MFNLFGKKTPEVAPKASFDILFHKECNGHIEHGTIYVDHAMQSLVNEPIRFAFVGIDQAAELTPSIMAHLWHMAESKGYIVHSLRSYATVVTLMPAPRLSVSTPTRRSTGGIATTVRKRTDAPSRQSVPVVS